MNSKAQDTLQPIAQHGQQKTPSAVGQLAKLVGIAALVLLVAFGGVAAWATTYLWTGFTQNAEQLQIGEPEQELPSFAGIEGGANFLIVGSDVCEPGYEELYGDRCADYADGGNNAGERNDVNLLVHISDEPRQVSVISFSRDIVMDLPECTDANGEVHEGYRDRINVAYSRGGLSCVAKAIEQLSGNRIQIQYAAKTTWRGVVNITNAIGGVEVCVENGINDFDTQLVLEPGTHTLAGDGALAFLRTRHAVGDGGDRTRMSNQQVYMSALARKIFSDGVLHDIPTLSRLANTTMQNVTPSQSLTDPFELVNIALALKDVPLQDIRFLSYPILANPENPNVNFIVDEESAVEMWDVLLSNQPFEVVGKTSGMEAPKQYDAATGYEIDPRTGLLIDPATQLLIDATTGELLDPENVPSLPTETPSGTEGTAGPIQLTEAVTGTNAAEVLCSSGRGPEQHGSFED